MSLTEVLKCKEWVLFCFSFPVSHRTKLEINGADQWRARFWFNIINDFLTFKAFIVIMKYLVLESIYVPSWANKIKPY